MKSPRGPVNAHSLVIKAKPRYEPPAYRRVLDAISFARRNPPVSLVQAAAQRGTSIQTIRLYASDAITYRNGRWLVRPHDKLRRTVWFLSDRGRIPIQTWDSDLASFIAEHSNAVRAHLRPPHPTRQLKDFEGQYLQIAGARYEFVTDPATIKRLARAGEIYFMDLYADEGA